MPKTANLCFPRGHSPCCTLVLSESVCLEKEPLSSSLHFFVCRIIPTCNSYSRIQFHQLYPHPPFPSEGAAGKGCVALPVMQKQLPSPCPKPRLQQNLVPRAVPSNRGSTLCVCWYPAQYYVLGKQGSWRAPLRVRKSRSFYVSPLKSDQHFCGLPIEFISCSPV